MTRRMTAILWLGCLVPSLSSSPDCLAKAADILFTYSEVALCCASAMHAICQLP